jgi:hypothetical protein
MPEPAKKVETRRLSRNPSSYRGSRLRLAVASTQSLVKS